MLSQRQAGLPGPVFDARALELCARKMANGTGDMRRALEACGRAVEATAREAARAAAATAAAATAATAGSPSSSARAAAATASAAAAATAEATSAPTEPRLIGLRQMSEALNAVLGSAGASNSNVRAIAALPPPQQALMAAVGKLLGDTLGSRGMPLRPPSAAAAPSPAAGGARGGGGGGGPRARFILSPAASLSLGSRGRASSLGSGARSGASSSVAGGRSREVTVGQLQEGAAALCRAVSGRGRCGGPGAGCLARPRPSQLVHLGLQR